jgi:hypothetical protein
MKMKKRQEKPAQYRQGDVFLFPAAIPRRAKASKDGVLALGEATGHRHQVFDGEVFVGKDGELYVLATGETELRHVSGTDEKADHDSIAVAPGEYRVVIQREYEPDGWRQVTD